MTTIKKKFIIKTEDKYGEKTYEIVNGTNFFDDGFPKQYSYESKMGKCDIYLNKNLLTISRVGDFNTLFSFDVSFEGIKNKFIYKTELLNEEFFTEGKNFSYDKDKKIFNFSYRLLDKNNIELNIIKFSIKEI